MPMSPEVKARIEALAVYDENMAHNGFSKGLLLCSEKVFPPDLKPGDVVQFDRFPTRVVEVATVVEVEGIGKLDPNGIRLSFCEDAFGITTEQMLSFYPRIVVSSFGPDSPFYRQPAIEWDNYFMRVPMDFETRGVFLGNKQ